MIRVSNKIIKALKIRKIRSATHHFIFLVKNPILRLNFDYFIFNQILSDRKPL